MAKNSQVNVGIKFRSDTKEVENSLNKLKKSLQDLQKIKLGDFKGSAKDFDQMQQTAKKVQIALEKAFNPTLNTTNIKTFQSELQKTVGSIDQVYNKLKLAGPQGEVAFHQMATEVLTTNLKLKETNSLIDSMGKTMVNTVKWGIASSIMNTFTQSVQGAFQYVQSLEKSLTNIRIVTGDSTEKMAQFAEQANRSAQALGRSTLDYTKASLTFYQQGLNEEDVQARTEATLKAQNITGAGSQMADYLTAVWNGYKVANEEAEVYVDKLAAVADSSASDMSQLAIAMSKVASTASTMGVDVDQLNAQIATVVATTRQAPESVGTAFKTIYTRMNDIKAGSDEAEISLGRYSGKMAELGFNVLDATGNLRDTGQVMEEIGDRWEDLTREQQVYLAQTMGGQRQVNQLMALFDNWTTYSELLNTSLESEGTLAEKNSRYMESLGAKMEQLGAAGERVKDALINENELKGGVQALTNLVNLMGNFIESIGGGSTALLAFGALATQVFQDTIAKQINNVITNIQNKKNNKDILEADIKETERYGESEGYERGVITHLVDNKKAIQGYYDIMEQGEINAYNNIIKTVAAQEQQTVALQKSKDAGEQFKTYLEKIPGVAKQLKEDLGGVAQNFSLKAIEAGEVITQNWNFKKIRQDSEGFIESVSTAFDDLTKSFGGTQAFQGIDSYEAFQKIQEELSSLREQGIQPTEEQIETLFTTWKNFTKELSIESSNVAILDETNSKLDLAKAKLEASEKSAKNFRNQIEQLATVRSFTQLISGIGQFAAGLRGVINLTKVWKNENLSAGEKVLQTFTNLSMTIPMLMNSYNKLKTASLVLLGSEAKKEAAKLKTLELQTKQKEKQIALGKLAELEANPISTLAERKAAEKTFQGLVEETEKLKGEINVLNGQSRDFFGLLSAKIPEILGFLGSIAGPLLAIGAVVTIGYTIYKIYNQASDAAKQAAENAKYAKEQYDKVKESFDNLTSSLKNYHEAEDALSKLVKGTEQWYDKVDQLNNKVLELLQNYPELAEYINMDENGVLSISEKGEKQIKNQQRQRVYTAAMTNAELQQKSYQADRTAKIVESGRDIYGFGGGQVLEKIIDEVAEKGIGILGDKDYLNQELELTPEQIAATQENTTSILQLIKSLDAGQAKVDTLKDSLIKTSLNNETEYQQSKNKTAFSDMYSDAINKASSSLGDDFYKEQSVYDYQTASAKIYKALDYQKVIDAYEQASGQKVERGFFGGYTVNGEKTTFETIKTYVKQSQANVDTAKILEETANRLSQAEKNFVNQDSRTKDLLFNSGLAGGFDKVNTDQLSIGDINRLESLNEKNDDLANYLNMSQEEVAEGFTKLKESVQEGTTNFIEGIEDTSIRETLRSLQSRNTYLSKQLAETIAQNLEDGFNMGGNASKKTISDFYQKLSDEQLQSAIKVAESYNFATGSAEDFRKTLEEAGVNTAYLSDEIIEAYLKTEKEIQNIKAENYRTDSQKVANGSSTLTLAQRQADGENLSEKQIKSLEAGLNDLLQVYPKLTQQIQTLKEAGLVGTSSYEEALRKLKMALVESYQDMAAAGTISLEEISQQMSGYIKTSEDLQMVQNAGIFTFQDYSQKLKLIANQYDSCKNELQEYILALQSHNEVAAATAQFNLQLALRSAENGEKYGIEAERISDLAQQYVQLAQSGNSAYQGLNKNAELASDTAVRYIRLNDSIETLQKNFTAVSETLDILSKYDLAEVLGDADYAKTFEQIKENVAGILNVSEELVDADFIKKYSEQIKEAANGSQEAVDALQDAFAEDIIANIKINDEEFYNTLGQTKQEFANWLNDLPEGEINLDENPAIQSLVTLLEQAGYSKDQIEDIFNAADIHLDLGYPDMSGLEEAAQDASQLGNETGANFSNGVAETGGVDVVENAETSSQTDNIEAAGVEATLTPQQADVSFPRVAAMAIPGVGFLPQLDGTVPGHITYYGVNVEPKVKEEQATKTNTAVGLEVKGATKSSGGKVSHKNSSGGNKKASKGGGGKKGGGGGGGKAKEPNKAKGATNKADRYRNNTVKANKLANQMTKLNKQQERLTGKDSLKNLQKQLQILKKQNETIRERIGLQRDEQSELANNLKKFGATFDKDGTLNNYFKVHTKIMQQYNNQVAKWNKMSAEQQQKNKDMLNNAKEVMDNALKDLQRYDKLQQEIAKSIQQQIDNAQEQIDLQAKQFELKIKAELDLSEAKRDWNKFRRDLIDEVRDDDILGLNKYRFADISSYFNNIGTGSIQYLTNRLKELTGTPDGSGIFSADYLNETLKNMTVTDRQARLEQIQKVMDDLQGQMEDFKSLADDIKESIFDTIDATQDAFDQQMDEYEYIGDLINHNIKVTESLFGDQAYDKMAKYYDRIEENNNKQLDFLNNQRDLWYNLMMNQKNNMNKIAQSQGTDSNLYKETQKRMKEYEKHWMDSVNNLNGKIEDALDNIMNKYANAISNIFLNFDLSLGGGRALDDISDEWDMLNDLADTYLDKINSAYEIEKLQNAFEDAIDDNKGNIAAQQSLNNLMEQQLAYLKDKEKLTQYDVDRANTLLQIEMKRLALEQSRNNKNRLRLRRDSQGNYTYQYTADTEAMNKAEQELADARNSLYNSDKAAYVDNLSAIQKSANELKDKLEDIWKDQNLSEEEALQKSYEVRKYYEQKINDLVAENASIRNNLMDSAFEELAKMYNISPDQFKAMSKEQQDAIFKDLMPQANSYAAQMVENIAGAGGMATFFQNLLGPLVQSYDNRVASISAIEEKSKTNFENIVNDTDILISQAEQLLDDNNKLVDTQKEQLNLLQSQLNVVSQMLQKYEEYKTSISDAVKSGYNELNNANASIVGTTRAREDAATAAQMKQLEKEMNTNSTWNMKNYTPQWSGSDFAALFGSASIIDTNKNSSQANKKVIQKLTDNITPVLSNLNTNTLFGTIDNNIFNSINNILNNILETNKEYHATSLAKQDAIRQAVVANQTIHIDADFPNAKDVRNIIEAIEGLANAAAQRANTKGI